MIDPDKRKTIYCLHCEGMGIKEIARRLQVSVNTVRSIISQKGMMPDTTRKDKIQIDEQLLRDLYTECEGYVQRIHEKLAEEEGISLGYSTLTRLIRELGLGQPRNQRCSHVDDQPGAEMQHDTTAYRLKIGDKLIRVVASLIYLRYCKMRYLKFYRGFNRFKMKCFFHEALSFWGYAAAQCIIDNTNLARLYGTGKNAVMVPEMHQFAKQYGFTFVCHEKGHANRKAGNERSFFTVETNFFPGRKFETLEDLNQQAFDWATVRMANRPVSKSALIPAKAFEYERGYLIKLPPYVPAPYLVLERGTDQYGYTSFDGNFYWVPGNKRDDVKVLQYSHHIKIYYQRRLLVEYELPPDGTKNEKFSPKGMPAPAHQPKYRKKPTALQEKQLRAADPKIDAYLNFALTHKGAKQKHRFIRQLHGLYQKLALSLFIKAIKRALTYRITDINTIERIAVLVMKDANYQTPFVQIDSKYQNRDSYIQGHLSDEVDLALYDQLLEDDDE
jgi:transposase